MRCPTSPALRRPFAALLAFGLTTSCVYYRVVSLGIPDFDTRAAFASRAVPMSRHPVPLARAAVEENFAVSGLELGRYASLDGLLAASGTRAFLAIHDDAVVYERYFGGTSPATILSSFSISKTYAAVVVGVAVGEGVLGSMRDPIGAYVPEVRGRPRYDQISLDELLRMTSGLDFREESVDGATMYYTLDLRSRMFLYGVERTPGTHYEYGSLNVQLLWAALHERLGGRTVSDYFGAKVWDRLGAVDAAEWSMDSQASGIEKFFGGFNATARDHARLGLLFLHHGTFNGNVILSPAWVDEALALDPVAGVVTTKDGPVRRGRYQWFVTVDGRSYFAKGYHGQYVFVVPDRSAVFVRFGDGYGNVDWLTLFERLADELASREPPH